MSSGILKKIKKSQKLDFKTWLYLYITHAVRVDHPLAVEVEDKRTMFVKDSKKNEVFVFNNYEEYRNYYLMYLDSIEDEVIDLAIYRMKIKKDIKGFLPFIVILLGLTYTIIYVLNVPYVRGINMSIVNSALICIGIELAFYLNLIPNNSKYKSRFSNSNLNMAIISLDGKTKYTTNVFDDIPKKILDDINNNSAKETYKKEQR